MTSHSPSQASGSTASAVLVEEVTPAPDVMDAVRALCDWPHLILFDSARVVAGLGRWSILTADPLDSWRLQESTLGTNPFVPLEKALASLAKPPLLAETGPKWPFAGGLAGMLGFELAGCFENLPRGRIDEFEWPVLCANLYDWALVWDHLDKQCWFLGQGWSAADSAHAGQAAMNRRDAVRGRLRAGAATPSMIRPRTLETSSFAVHPKCRSNFSAGKYREAVAFVIESIRAGDIFQANLTQRLLAPAVDSPVELYSRLRRTNPAPMAGLMLEKDWAIMSASPERFVEVQERVVTTRPIKGTRRRQRLPEADLFLGDELRSSGKDFAENVMITDLMRNDLSRVCRPGTVHMNRLCELERFETVLHLVSEVQGTLRDSESLWSLLSAAWPGGSISGAPKIRALEILAEIEPHVRGPYTGSLFYATPDGRFDSNLLIRSWYDKDGWLTAGVGGGITVRSDPQEEYEETWHKASGLLAALGPQ